MERAVLHMPDISLALKGSNTSLFFPASQIRDAMQAQTIEGILTFVLPDLNRALTLHHFPRSQNGIY